MNRAFEHVIHIKTCLLFFTQTLQRELERHQPTMTSVRESSSKVRGQAAEPENLEQRWSSLENGLAHCHTHHGGIASEWEKYRKMQSEVMTWMEKFERRLEQQCEEFVGNTKQLQDRLSHMKVQNSIYHALIIYIFIKATVWNVPFA